MLALYAGWTKLVGCLIAGANVKHKLYQCDRLVVVALAVV